MKNRCVKIFLGLLIVFGALIFVRGVFAMHQRCEPSTDCVISEYVFENDGYTPITTDDYCQITITNPDDSVIVNAANMSDKNDGWYYYTTSISSPEGLYRALMCCDVGGAEEGCLAKTFILGPFFDWLAEENIGAVGTADSGTTTTLIDDALTEANDFWNGMTLIIYTGTNSGEIRQISDFDAASDMITVRTAFTSAIDNTSKYLIRRDMNWAERVWEYTSSIGSTLIDNLHNAIWKSTTVRKLTSRQIGDGVEYIPGVTESGTVTQVANKADQATIKYDVDLVRKSTFDFAGIADSGSKTTLVDGADELDQPDNHWNNYELWMMSGNNVGEKRVITSFDHDTHTLTVSEEFTYAIATDDRYVISHERKLVHSIWNWSERTLIKAGDVSGGIAEAVWGWTTGSGRKLTSQYTDEASPVDLAQVADVSSLATSAELAQTETDIIAEIDDNEAKIDLIYGDTQSILTKIGVHTDLTTVNTLFGRANLLKEKWDTHTAEEIVGYVDDVESALGDNADTCAADDTIFGNIQCVRDKWGDTQTAQTIYDKAKDAYDTIVLVRADINYEGSGTTVFDDIVLLKGYTDDLETLVGDPADLASAATLFGKVKDVRTKLDQLDTLESKLDTVDGIIDNIRASQILDYAVELSDVGEVLTTKIYRAKLTVLDYESNPVNASAAPTIIIYDALRATADTGSMTSISTGVYEYTYTVASDATSGLWESVVSVDLGGALPLILNDYWEVEGSPAQVIINYMSDTTIPSISANVTISNEGNSGYEYQYEWCVVTSQDNQCGGDDDIDYASAAKYLNVGQDWTTELGLTIDNIGELWFKVVVYYGTEASGASRTFTAVEEEVSVPGGGVPTSLPAPIPPATNTNIYSKLLEIQNELGYHDTDRTAYRDLANTRYSLGALPDQLSEPLYTVLTGVSSDIKIIGGTKGYDLDDLYEVSRVDTADLKYIKNKSLELQAMIDVNKLLIDKVANEPIIKGWFEWGSVVLKILVINPSDFEEKIIPFKYYLPREVDSQHIINKEDLELDYDQERGLWFVHRDIKLEPGESITKKIEIKDIWIISEEEIKSLRSQVEELMKPLERTSYFAQAATLKSDADRLLDSILRKQHEYKASPEEHIVTYRENKESLQAVESNIEALKTLLAEASGKSGVLGSLFGVSTTMTWAIIIMVVVGIAVLMILLYVLLMRHRALEEYVAPGKKLKAPPVVNVKKRAKKIKSKFITYFLPPFGKPRVNLKQSIKIIKILVIVVVLIILIFLGIYLTSFILSKKIVISDTFQLSLEEQARVLGSSSDPSVLSSGSKDKGRLGGVLDSGAEEESAAVLSEEAEMPLDSEEETIEQNKLKILETGLGWLNVRSNPSINSGILTKVESGVEFIYTDKEDGWYKIILEDKTKGLPGEASVKEGWVFGKYIETIPNL